MTKEQALQILVQVASVYRGTLAEHDQIQEALKVLASGDKKSKEKDNG